MHNWFRIESPRFPAKSVNYPNSRKCIEMTRIFRNSDDVVMYESSKGDTDQKSLITYENELFTKYFLKKSGPEFLPILSVVHRRRQAGSAAPTITNGYQALTQACVTP